MKTQKVIIIPQDDIVKQFKTIGDTLAKILTRLEVKENGSSKVDVKYLTRKETARLLKISLPTLTSYVKKNLIPVHRIGSRVLFLKSEVLEAVKNIKFK